jgi:hypothetical protein
MGMTIYQSGEQKASGQIQNFRTSRAKAPYFLILSQGLDSSIFDGNRFRPGQSGISGEYFGGKNCKIHIRLSQPGPAGTKIEYPKIPHSVRVKFPFKINSIQFVKNSILKFPIEEAKPLF